MARFLPFFIWESIRGGIDVALRVLAPTPRVAPGFHDYTITLESEPARLLFANTVSLLPGTLSADVKDDLVRVHSLDKAVDTAAELQRLEHRIADLYREHS